MNRPKKARASETPAATNASNMSRTMQLAVGRVQTTFREDDVSANLQRRGTWFSAPLAAAPHTKVERYWAARALVAETLLSARGQHQVELADMRRVEERKREREIEMILQANDQRQTRSERLMMVCLVVLVGFMCWLVVVIAPDRAAKSGKPSHFTIPILSPFASVVEHETGIFGTKIVALFVVVMGIATYGALRHRFSQWRTR